MNKEAAVAMAEALQEAANAVYRQMTDDGLKLTGGLRTGLEVLAGTLSDVLTAEGVQEEEDEPLIGARVGALLRMDGLSAHLLGYGVFMGREIPPKFGKNHTTSILNQLKIASPKIILDNGDTVWGCECWWGPEENVKMLIEGKLILDARIEDERK